MKSPAFRGAEEEGSKCQGATGGRQSLVGLPATRCACIHRSVFIKCIVQPESFTHPGVYGLDLGDAIHIPVQTHLEPKPEGSENIGACPVQLLSQVGECTADPLNVDAGNPVRNDIPKDIVQCIVERFYALSIRL